MREVRERVCSQITEGKKILHYLLKKGSSSILYLNTDNYTIIRYLIKDCGIPMRHEMGEEVMKVLADGVISRVDGDVVVRGVDDVVEFVVVVSGEILLTEGGFGMTWDETDEWPEGSCNMFFFFILQGTIVRKVIALCD